MLNKHQSKKIFYILFYTSKCLILKKKHFISGNYESKRMAHCIQEIAILYLFQQNIAK